MRLSSVPDVGGRRPFGDDRARKNRGEVLESRDPALGAVAVEGEASERETRLRSSGLSELALDQLGDDGGLPEEWLGVPGLVGGEGIVDIDQSVSGEAVHCRIRIGVEQMRRRVRWPGGSLV